MALPIVAYKSLGRVAGVTLAASSTESGFTLADAFDLRGWKLWKSGTVTTGITIDIDMGSDTGSADCLGLVNHNITSEAGTVEVRADTAAGPNPPTTVRQAAYTPTYGDVDLKLFSAASNLRRWRLVLAKGGNFSNKPYIGEIFLGMRMTLPEYPHPGLDPYLKQTEGSVTHSHGGHYLGAVTRGKTHRFDISTGDTGMIRSFLTSDLDPFVDTHFDLFQPFIYQIDADDTAFKRPVYVVKPPDGGHSRTAVGGVWTRLKPVLPCVEAHMEAPTS